VEGIPPTRLTLEPGQNYKILKLDYPPGVAKTLASSGAEKVSLYEGKVTIRARLGPDPRDVGKIDSLKFRVKYQACNDRACLAPAELTVVAPVSTGRGTIRVPRAK